MNRNLNSFLSKYYSSSPDEIDYRPLVGDLLRAATRALDAYADTAGEPRLSYNISNTAPGVTKGDVQHLAETAVANRQAGRMQKGTD